MAEKKTSDFYWACRNGDVDAVKRILPSLSSADVNRVESNGSTALHAASYYGHAAIVQLLLQRGADVTIQNKYQKTAKEEASTDEVRAMFESMIKPEDLDDAYDDLPQSEFVQVYPNKDGMDKTKLATRIFKARLGTYNANKYTISAESNLEHLEERYQKACEERCSKKEQEERKKECLKTGEKYFRKYQETHDFHKVTCLETGEKYFRKYQETHDFHNMLRFYTEETPFYRIARNDVPFLIEMYKHLLRNKMFSFKGRVYRANHLFSEDVEPYQWALNHPQSLLEIRRTASTSAKREVALYFLNYRRKKRSLQVMLEMDFDEPCFTVINLQSLTLYPEEEEILVLSGTFFQVTQIQEGHDGYLVISLKHVPVDDATLWTVI